MNETDDNYNQLDSKSCQFINKNQEDEAVWILNHLIINKRINKYILIYRFAMAMQLINIEKFCSMRLSYSHLVLCSSYFIGNPNWNSISHVQGVG